MVGEPHTPESAISKPAKSSSEKRVFKQHGRKMNVKGFYYHAAEYQRQKQVERGRAHQIFRSIIEPIAIHERAFRLRVAASRNGAGNFFGHSSAVLDNEFVRQAIDGKKHITDATRERFRAKSTAHGIIERSHFKKEQEGDVRQALQRMFDTKGKITEDDRKAALKAGLSEKDIDQFTKNIQDHKDVFTSVPEMRDKLTDEMIYGGLTLKQQDLARKLALAAGAMTVATYAKYAVIALTPITLGQSFWVGFGFGAASRGSRLAVEGLTYAIGKDRGITMPTAQHHSFLGALTTVDWEQDPKTRAIQIGRAMIVSGLIGVGIKEATPWVEHTIGDLLHHTSGAADSSGDHAAQITGHGTNPKIQTLSELKNSKTPSDGGGVHHVATSSLGSEAGKGAVDQASQFTTETHQVVLNQFGVSNYHAEAWAEAQHGATWAYDVHNSWTDHSMTWTVYAHGDQINYFALHLPDGKVALVDLHSSAIHWNADHTQYSFTFDNTNTHDLFTVMDAQGNSTGSLSSAEAYHLFNASGQMHVFDSQHLANNQSSDFKWATQENVRGTIEFGHFDKTQDIFTRYGMVQGHGGFGDLHELTLIQHGTALDNDEVFHSAIAPQLQSMDDWFDKYTVDNWRDFLNGHYPQISGATNIAASFVDNLHDWPLQGTDAYAYTVEHQFGLAAMETAVAMGLGYGYAKYQPSTKAGRWVKRGVGAGAFLASPPLAGAGAVGALIARARKNKKQKAERDKSKEAEAARPASPLQSTPATPLAGGAGGDQPSDTLPADQSVDIPVLPAAPAPPPPPDGTAESVAPTDVPADGGAIAPPLSTAPIPSEENPAGSTADEATSTAPETQSNLPVTTPNQQTVVKGFLERLRDPENNEFYRHIAELGTLINVKISPEHWLSQIMDNPNRWQHALSGILQRVTDKNPNSDAFHDTLERVFEKLKGETQDKRLLDFIHLAEFGALFYRLKNHPEVLDKVRQIIGEHAQQGITSVTEALRGLGNSVSEEIATVAGEAGEEALPLLEELAPVLAV